MRKILIDPDQPAVLAFPPSQTETKNKTKQQQKKIKNMILSKPPHTLFCASLLCPQIVLGLQILYGYFQAANHELYSLNQS